MKVTSQIFSSNPNLRNFEDPIVNRKAVRRSYYTFLAVNVTNAALASKLATQMQHVSALNSLGLSLQDAMRRSIGTMKLSQSFNDRSRVPVTAAASTPI
jgi:hypothetical protein